MAPITANTPVVQAEITALSSDFQAHRPVAIAQGVTDIVFRNLVDEILTYLPILEVILFGSTNRSLHAQVTPHLSRAFCALLGKYFLHPAAFRDIMRDTGTVLSGSTVLSFVIRDTHWAPGDLDIYTPCGDAAEKIREHLVSIQGFKLASSRGTAPGAAPIGYDEASFAIQNIDKYEKVVECDGHIVTKLSLDLIESKSSSPVDPITEFHSTLVMNYLTADSVVVLYPLLTFARVGVRQTPKSSVRDWKTKYTRRGFMFLEDPVPCGCSCRNRERSTHDSATMRVVFGNRETADLAKERTQWWHRPGWVTTWYGRTKKCNNPECPYTHQCPYV